MVAVSLAAIPMYAVDHNQFTNLLAQHVRNGLVNYKALKNDKRLSEYLESLSKTNVKHLKGADAMSFWINVYNAQTLKVVCDNYPVNSIMDIQGGQVWKKYNFTIDGKSYTLESVENSILRKMGDARIHFALVCAAMSCPPLRSEAYVAGKLDAQLSEQARGFLAHQENNAYDLKTMRGTLSRIFEWYASDFGSSMEELVEFVSKYAPPSVAPSLKSNAGKWKFEFGHYDWSLNSVPN